MLLAPKIGELYVSCQSMEANGNIGILNDGIGKKENQYLSSH